MTSKPGVIVCERKGTWSAGLRRHLPRDFRLRETRFAADCLAELAESPASVVVVEFSETNLEPSLELIAAAVRGFPQALVVVVAPRGGEPLEWLAREAGAVHFTTSPRDADAVARLTVRHAARIPAPSATFAARIWDSLPWPDAATR